MPDPNFTITSGKVLNITGSKNHIISSVGVCYYIQVILEESATNPEGHEHLFMCMACFVYILSVLTDISFDAFCFFAIAVYLSPLSWSIELIIIFLFWGEVSVF